MGSEWGHGMTRNKGGNEWRDENRENLNNSAADSDDVVFVDSPVIIVAVVRMFIR